MTEDPTPPDSAAGTLAVSDERFRLLVQSVRDYAIFMLGPTGTVLTWNAGAERFKGYKADEIIGQHFSRFYPQEALARGLPDHELQVAMAEGSFEDEGWRVRKDGSHFWANVVITALRDADGDLVGFGKVARDLTERRQHEEALRHSEERFRSLIESAPDYAIFMLDANGNVASWNVGAQRVKGYAPSEILGKHFSIFYPPDVRESGWPQHELQMATQRGSFVDEGWRIRQDGSRMWANVTITALRDDGGHLLGFAKVTRDLSERKQAEAAEVASQQREEILQAERSARMAAQRAARVKDEFLATLSHELRTPLSAIAGWTQILRKVGQTAKPEEFERALSVIERNTRAQVNLIDDLLDLSKVMSGKLRLDLQPVALIDVVNTALDSARPSAEAKGIRLKQLLDPAPPIVTADSGRLQQVIWNLLSNAIKFTPKGGQVQVVLQRVNSHVELSVSDTGVGIPVAFLPHVFDRFAQLDGSTTRSFGGLGLGLAIAKQLVELHGGSIRAASEGEGQGATFFVELPLALAHKPETDGRAHPTVEIVESSVLSLPQLAGVHAVVIDDEADSRDLLRRVLEDQGARVTTYDGAEDALMAIPSLQPTVIISDIGMPKMDGFAFMRAWRSAEPSGSRVPAMALTAFARSEDRKRALLAGFQAHLAKPFDLSEFILLTADLVRR